MKKFLWFTVYSILSTACYAGIITHTDYTSNTTITASGQNANENRIYNEFNGNIDNTNIKTGGVTGTNIANQTITNTQIANNTVGINQLSTTTAIISTTTQLGNAVVTGPSIASNTVTGSTSNVISAGGAGNIATATISTPDFRTNAVTLSSTGAAGLNGPFTTYVATQTIVTVGKPVFIFATLTLQGTAGSGAFSASTAMSRDGGTQLPGCASLLTANGGGGQANWNTEFSIVCSETPSAGSHSYTLTYQTSNYTGISTPSWSINVFELRT